MTYVTKLDTAELRGKQCGKQNAKWHHVLYTYRHLKTDILQILHDPKYLVRWNLRHLVSTPQGHYFPYKGAITEHQIAEKMENHMDTTTLNPKP